VDSEGRIAKLELYNVTYGLLTDKKIFVRAQIFTEPGVWKLTAVPNQNRVGYIIWRAIMGCFDK